MCGRFAGFTALDTLRSHFPIDVAQVTVVPHFNIAPTQEILAIARYDGLNHLVRFHWGLVPFWAKDRSIGSRLINARSETAAVKPSFRRPFRNHRCLIPASGFYEWKKEQGRKQPMFLTLPDGSPFAFAGLWDIWHDPAEAQPYRSCTILTCTASESVRPIHHRMPVILKPEAHNRWLDPLNQDVAALNALITNERVTELVGVPVSTRVNSVGNDSPDNIRPTGFRPPADTLPEKP